MSTFGTFDEKENGWGGWTPSVLTGNLLGQIDPVKTLRGREAAIVETNANQVVIEAKKTGTWAPSGSKIWFAVIGINPDAQGVKTTGVAVRIYNGAALIASDSITVYNSALSIDRKQVVFDFSASNVTRIEIEYTTAGFTSVFVGGFFWGYGETVDIDSDYVFSVFDTASVSTSYAGDVFTPAVRYRQRINSYPMRLIPEADFIEKIRRIIETAGKTVPVAMRVDGSYGDDKSIFGILNADPQGSHYAATFDMTLEIKQII